MLRLLLCGILAFGATGLGAEDSPREGIKQGFKTAGKDVGKAAVAVGHAVRNGAKAVGRGGRKVGHGFKQGAKDVGHGVKSAVKQD